MTKKKRKYRDYSAGPVWLEDKKVWHAEVRYPDGRRPRKQSRRKKKVLSWWIEEQRKLDTGEWRKPRGSPCSPLTLGELFDRYSAFSKMHHRSYENFIKVGIEFWERNLGRVMPAGQVTLEIVDGIKAAYIKTVRPATVNRKLEVLRMVYRWANEPNRRLLPVNPISGLALFKLNNEIVRCLSPEQYRRLIDAAEKGRWFLRPIIELATHTGLRKRNILDLRTGQCDFTTGIIRTVNTKSLRTHVVPMNERVRQIVDELMERQKSGKNGGAGSDFLFPHMQGEHAGQAVRDVKKGFKAALERAGIDRKSFRFHDLRHTFASTLAKNHAGVQAIKDLLGHADIRSTLRYAHLDTEHLAGHVRNLEKALSFSCPSHDATAGNQEQHDAKGGDAKPLTAKPKRI